MSLTFVFGVQSDQKRERSFSLQRWSGRDGGVSCKGVESPHSAPATAT